ncbi:hypothetical protein GCM10009743_23580 [Kribbella swartbergensis]
MRGSRPSTPSLPPQTRPQSASPSHTISVRPSPQPPESRTRPEPSTHVNPPQGHASAQGATLHPVESPDPDLNRPPPAHFRQQENRAHCGGLCDRAGSLSTTKIATAGRGDGAGHPGISPFLCTNWAITPPARFDYFVKAIRGTTYFNAFSGARSGSKLDHHHN